MVNCAEVYSKQCRIMNENTIQRTTPTILVIFLLAAGVLIFTLATSLFHTAGPVCLSRIIFHVPCPGCGLTRSLQSVWQGDINLAFRYHPLGPPLFLLCSAIVLTFPLSRHSTAVSAKIRSCIKVASRRSFQIGLFALFIAVWLMRTMLAQRGDTTFIW